MISAFAAVALAGAWTREAGSYYVKAGADVYKPSEYYDPLRGPLQDSKYLGQQYGLYGELGVLKVHPVQLTASVPFVIASNTFVVRSPTGEEGVGKATAHRAGDLHLAVQTEVWGGKGPRLAAALAVKVPLYANGHIGEEYGAFNEVFPKIGDGQVDLTGWVLAGGSVPKTPLWIDSAVGYRHRTEWFVGWPPDERMGLAFVDGLPFRATFGATMGRLIAMIQTDGSLNFHTDRYTRESFSAGPAVLVTLHGGLGIEARYNRDWWVANAARGQAVGIGLSLRDPP